MKGFRFETFDVTPENREAYNVCRAVAKQQYAGPCPVVLLGGEGAGKTHLLWSIVKEVRSSQVKTGLALVMAEQIPDKVRDLIRDAAPIRQGQPAILLVDELERFRDNAGVLEQVATLFLENGHTVMVASEVHPDRVPALSETFKALLDSGHMAELRPRESGPAVAAAAVEALHREREELARQLAEKTAAEAELEGQVIRLEAELEALRSRTAVDPVFDGLSDAQAAAEAAVAEQARLHSLLDGQEALEEALRDAEAGRAAAGQALEAQTNQAEAILSQVHEMQAMLPASEASLAEQVQELVALAEAHGAGPGSAESQRLEAELAEAREVAEALRLQLDQERQRLEAALEEARVECDHATELFEEARAERGRLSVALDAGRGRSEAVEFELEKARKQLSLLTAEMDALRDEAASQVALANMQAGEMENRIVQLEAALEAARATGRDTGEETRRLADQLAEAAEAMQGIAERYEIFRRLSLSQRPEEADADDAQVLFDPVLLDATPDPPPKKDSLNRVVEAAFQVEATVPAEEADDA